MFSRILVAGAISAFLVGPAAATQLQGDDRAQIIKNTSASCLDRSVKEQETRPFTLAVVDAYCTCFGTAIADGFSVEELTAASNGMTPEMLKKREGFVSQCGASTFGKVKK